jgi:cyanophycinase-like exopeptidase
LETLILIGRKMKVLCQICVVALLVVLTFSERLSIPIGGSLLNGSPILNIFFGRKVAFITAADPSPEIVGPQTQQFFDRRGINATWVKVFEPCVNKVNDPELIRIVEQSDAVYFTGGYSDKLQMCLFGDKPTYVPTPLLLAIQKVKIMAGSSAGAMVQPMKDMLLTRNPIESYNAVVQRKVPFSPHAFRAFRRGHVDVHFSERGRQGRLFVFAWMTKTRFAFGIDENTGIVEHEDGRIQVVGEKGVVVYDMISQSLSNGILHYLTEGDILLPDGRVVYPAWKRPCTLTDTPARNSTNIFMNFKQVSVEHALYSKKHTVSWCGWKKSNR